MQNIDCNSFEIVLSQLNKHDLLNLSVTCTLGLLPIAKIL